METREFQRFMSKQNQQSWRHPACTVLVQSRGQEKYRPLFYACDGTVLILWPLVAEIISVSLLKLAVILTLLH